MSDLNCFINSTHLVGQELTFEKLHMETFSINILPAKNNAKASHFVQNMVIIIFLLRN